MISVVVPAYREGAQIGEWLNTLYASHPIDECLVVDASDAPAYEEVKNILDHRFAQAGLQFIAAQRKGRAAQMNQGAKLCQHAIILFLHADTILPQHALTEIQTRIDKGALWGRFDVRFDRQHWYYRMIAAMMNWRSRITGIATGDQAMFMTRKAFERVGGFDDIALMEDISMTKKLKALGSPACLKAKVQTASRRWERQGVARTILLMWWLRLAYFFGVPAGQLARWYR